MNVNEEEEIKKEFQLERVILFSDAVFAIIITIMVIELKLPETIRDAASGSTEMHHAIKGLIFKFTGYFVSFFLVSRFWIIHLKIFSFLKDYTTRLLAYNLFFLFCVSLFPFGITLITGALHFGSQEYGWGMTGYITIFFMSTLAQSLLIRYLVKHKNSLCYFPEKIETVLKWRSTKFMIASIIFFFVVLILANYFSLPSTLYMYIIAGFGVSNGVVARKLYPNEAKDSQPLILRIFSRRQKKSRKAQLPAGD